MKICKNCGEINQTDTEFCCNCGKNSFVISDEVQCPHCGADNDKSFSHCINCGNLVRPVPEKMPQPAAAVAPAIANATTAVDLRNYNQNLEEVNLKETTKCLKCGNELQINSIFCFKCGTAVSKQHEHRIVKRTVCTYCGTPNLSENPYCSYCYASLVDAKTEEFQIVHEIVQSGKSVFKQAMLNGNEKYKICNNCGALNKQKSEFCIQCGLKLVLEEQKRYCVNCGAENDPDAQFCTKCQWSFEGVRPQSQSVWRCRHCDHLNEGENLFCSNCGKKQKDEEQK